MKEFIAEFNKEAAMNLLKDIISIPTVNGRDSVNPLSEYLRDYFEAAGITSQIQEIDETHSNVIAFIKGVNESKTVIWNGHMDTVAYGDLASWESDPKVPVIKDGRMYGRGTSDMKSGLAAMVFALTEINKNNFRPKHNIQFIATCDEETGGAGAKAIISEKKMSESDMLLIGEPTGLLLGIAQKGCLWTKISVRGKTGHGAYPKEGINAIEAAFFIANGVKEYVNTYKHAILGEATAQITKCEGGIQANMTPDECALTMDIRLVPELNYKDITNVIFNLMREWNTNRKNMLNANSDDETEEAHVYIDFINNKRAIEISTEAQLAKSVIDALHNTETPIDYTGISYFTDAGVLVEDKPKMQVLLFGPGEAALAHKPNEYVEIDKYLRAIEVFIEAAL
ncbi:MAG: M20 family metallopeptidase [Lachnospiraceae bacterium]|jgi:succinyl-diaminopimelate desuccinylase|nr:M20 family metallopeptidase [Lachnospiraceae bacterium]